MKPIVLWFVVCVLAALAACAAPVETGPERFPGNAAFLERARAGW